MVQTAYQQYHLEEGEEKEEVLLNLHKIRSIGYIKEAIAWNADINADRVSAMGMLMILRADREQRLPEFEATSSGLEEDDFWSRGYGTANNLLGFMEDSVLSQ